MDKDLVKRKIVDFEHFENCNGLSGCDVRVINVKVGKNKATADVIVNDGDRTVRTNNCEYPLVELGL